MTRVQNFGDKTTQPTRQKMSYGEAQSLRKKSLSSLLTDQLLQEGSTVGGSIKSALSDKTRATMTGIKQKFDPLNIVKFMTGGSTLASTMFGRLTGRSEEDMRFFAGKGKASQVGDKATKVGKVEVGDEGLIKVLSQIYSLLKTSQENEVLKRELEGNKSEEKQSENERRHKELLKALGAVSTGGGNITVVKEDSGGGILEFLASTVEKWFGMKISDIGQMVTKVTAMASFLAPVLAGSLTIFAPGFIAEFLRRSMSDDATKSDPIENKDYTLSKPISQMSWTEKLGGAIGAKKQSIDDTIERGMELMADGRGKPLFTPKEAEDIKKFYEITVPQQLIKTAEPVSSTEGTSAPATTPAAQPTSTQAPSATPSAIATPVASTPASAKVTAAINENNTLQITEKTTSTSSTDLQKQNIVNVDMAKKVYRGPMPSVRNAEMTFQRMIYDSTRVT
jgi:hypothetical protein